MGATWGPHWDGRTQVGPMLAPWTLLSGMMHCGLKVVFCLSMLLLRIIIIMQIRSQVLSTHYESINACWIYFVESVFRVRTLNRGTVTVWYFFLSYEVIHLDYHQTANISRNLPVVGNKIVDNFDVVGASLVGAAPTTSSILILDLPPGFNGLGEGNCKTRQETFKFGDLVRLVLDVLLYFFAIWLCAYTVCLGFRNFENGRSCTETQSQSNPWWAVELRLSPSSYRVIIYNRDTFSGNVKGQHP